ncbi:hypothetical protein MKS88_003451 [Plasmodium brasilianum]|uniref:Fam-l protein n=2 Tax=Plasmodium (Plasmodium) TaxID=418103 RepID=A0A1D3RJE3_PLAMA|nr:Plasmodium exported protein, unknown function [Plasmodium malariae]KAI4838028.1 hypothetical protein MKS88_003451 [Plasmodium brasilianum]SCN45305.1 Plasmodium exported protein, unknown function [Plasmodium malariae]
MEQNNKFIFFIKIYMFMFLYCICHFYYDKGRFIKFLRTKYGFDGKLDTRVYRLLGIYIEDIYPYVGDLELNIPYITKRKSEKLLTTDNEKWEKEKKEKLYKSLLYKEKLIKKLMKNKFTMLHKSYSYYEKKVLNGLNDKAFFKKMMLINDKDYKKLKRKKYALRLFFLLFLFLLVLMIPILDLSLSTSSNSFYLLTLLCKVLGYSSSSGSITALDGTDGATSSLLSSFCSNSSTIPLKVSSILMYCVPILIMGIMLILGIYFYYKNVIKYKKIKSLEAFNEW